MKVKFVSMGKLQYKKTTDTISKKSNTLGVKLFSRFLKYENFSRDM